MARNQCDGCQEKRHKVSLSNGHWFTDPNGNTHIMGEYRVLPSGQCVVKGYPDLMACEAPKYNEDGDR